MSKNYLLLPVLLTGTLLFTAARSHAATAPTLLPGPSSGSISNAPGMAPVAPAVRASGPAPADQVYNPANDNPGLYTGLPTQMPEGLTQEPESLWKRSTLLGDLGGLRTQVDNAGFTISPVYTGEVFGNTMGGVNGQGTVYAGSFNLPLTVYLEKIFSGWEGGVIHANALWISGRSLSGAHVGDISGTSNISGVDTLRLQELWYQQTFWSMRASVKAGLIAADAEFFASDSASLFINGTFGTFTLIGANLPNPPVYPVATPAVRFLVQPIPRFYFQTGIYYGDAGAQGDNRSGVDFHFHSSSGSLIFTEIGYLYNQAAGDRGPVGTYKLGSFVHTADFDTWSSQAAGTPKGAGSDYGFYGIMDQEIYKHAGKTISVFTRGGGAPADVNAVDWYVDGGFNFEGFIPGRRYGIFGIAAARSSFSHAYSDFQAATGGTNPFNAETVLELTYKDQISPWWTIQPDLQYIWCPSGESGSANALVLGMRTSVSF